MGFVPEPFRSDAAVVGTCKRGEMMRGAPSGVPDDRSGDPSPDMGDRSRCVSAAEANRRHSSSHATTTITEKAHSEKVSMMMNRMLSG